MALNQALQTFMLKNLPLIIHGRQLGRNNRQIYITRTSVSFESWPLINIIQNLKTRGQKQIIHTIQNYSSVNKNQLCEHVNVNNVQQVYCAIHHTVLCNSKQLKFAQHNYAYQITTNIILHIYIISRRWAQRDDPKGDISLVLMKNQYKLQLTLMLQHLCFSIIFKRVEILNLIRQKMLFRIWSKQKGFLHIAVQKKYCLTKYYRQNMSSKLLSKTKNHANHPRFQ
eukprot:TRINITY_DN754_c1_g1_i5.p7 TRINITY_DN754_c1_g1~~TRINITY_DN754_c1_g1_i5.p7  ORF type:complete len:226 (+),score=-24.21 TRINITY_DN754_c1_g1_i5:2668-3345(+)